MSELVNQVLELSEEDKISFFQSAVEGMTLGTVNKLVKRLEKEWDVQATPQFGGPPPKQDVVEEVVQSAFAVVVTGFENKLQVIKEIRSLTGLKLRDSKALLDQLPATVLEKVGQEEADQAKKQLEEIGAVVEIK